MIFVSPPAPVFAVIFSYKETSLLHVFLKEKTMIKGTRTMNNTGQEKMLVIEIISMYSNAQQVKFCRQDDGLQNIPV